MRSSAPAGPCLQPMRGRAVLPRARSARVVGAPVLRQAGRGGAPACRRELRDAFQTTDAGDRRWSACCTSGTPRSSASRAAERGLDQALVARDDRSARQDRSPGGWPTGCRSLHRDRVSVATPHPIPSRSTDEQHRVACPPADQDAAMSMYSPTRRFNECGLYSPADFGPGSCSPSLSRWPGPWRGPSPAGSSSATVLPACPGPSFPSATWPGAAAGERPGHLRGAGRDPQ
jgi:hypothetical protein